MKINKAIIPLLFVVLSLALIGCSNQTNTGAKDLEIKALQEKINGYELDIKNLNEQREGYKDIIDSSIPYMNKEDFIKLAQNEWSYGIEVNGKSIQPDGIAKIDVVDLKIILSERQTVLSSTVGEIFKAGKISGNFYDHLTIIGQQPSNTSIIDGTTAQGMVYEFTDMQKGTIVKLELSDELRERLDLKTNIISVEVM